MEKIVSKTPLRISFVGGGTDIAGFYRRCGGEVISTTIDKYITVEVMARTDDQIGIKTAGSGGEQRSSVPRVPGVVPYRRFMADGKLS